MDLTKNDTALVVIDPQNDVLRAFGKNEVRELRTLHRSGRNPDGGKPLEVP